MEPKLFCPACNEQTSALWVESAKERILTCEQCHTRIQGELDPDELFERLENLKRDWEHALAEGLRLGLDDLVVQAKRALADLKF